jgi:hypothetical protein
MRESFGQTFRDVQRVANKAATWIHDARFSVVIQEAHDRIQIMVHVQDDATPESYHALNPEGAVRHDIAESLIHESRSHREQAGAESWRLCMPGPWLIC